ncbi:MAG: WD40 repeat domain-containing serine/threonine-protein kinase [Eubacteriales bacterium]|nr:WD40 repeat domain-containing serine/threonine-protein kinase [Eubacteriales bacterium]
MTYRHFAGFNAEMSQPENRGRFNDPIRHFDGSNAEMSKSEIEDVSMAPSITLPPVYEIEDGPFMGGMGCVYKVRHREWNTLLAVKQPLPEMTRNASARERFLHECELWVLLGLHAHIVLCHYVRNLDGVPTVFAEWIPGGDLRTRIVSGDLYDGLAEDPLPVQLRLLDISVQIARGMAYAHGRGLVHRDLKPANIMFDADGTAKITDFGLAALRNRDDAQGRGFGTAAYAAPEQQRGLSTGPAADLWSFGVLLLELFLGERLWKNSLYVPAGLETWLPQSRVPVPEEIRGLIRRCCEPDPLRRAADFTAAAEILTGCWQRLAQSDYPRPDSGEACLAAGSWNNRALSYLDLGMDAEAGDSWKKALRADPGHMASLYNRTMYLWRKAELDDLGALRALQNAYNSDPRPESADLLSRFLLERQSAEPLERLLSSWDGSPDAGFPSVSDTSFHTACPPDTALTGPGGKSVNGGQKRSPDSAADPCASALRIKDQRRRVMSKTTRGLCVRGEEAVFLFEDRTAELWNYRRGTRISVLRTERAHLQDAVFTPDGGVCAASSEGVLVFDRSGRRQAFFPVAEGSVHHVILCGDEQSLPARADGAESSRSPRFFTGGAENSHNLPAHAGGAAGSRSPLFHAGGYSLLVHAGRTEGGRNKEYAIRISLRDGKRISKIRFTGVNPGVFLPLRGGEELILAAGHRLLRIDPAAGKLLRSYTYEAAGGSPADPPVPFTCAAIRDDESVLAACAGEVLWLWDAQSGEIQTHFPVGACHTLLFVRDRRFILSAGADPEVKLWELSTGRCLRSFAPHRGGVRCVRAAENGEAFLSAGEYDGVDYQHIPAFDYTAAWKLCRAEETQRLRENERRFRELILRSAAHWKKREKAEALEDLALARAVPGYQRHPAYLRLNAAMGKSLRVRSLLGIWSRGAGARKDSDSRADSGTQAADPSRGTDDAGSLSIRAK